MQSMVIVFISILVPLNSPLPTKKVKGIMSLSNKQNMPYSVVEFMVCTQTIDTRFLNSFMAYQLEAIHMSPTQLCNCM